MNPMTQVPLPPEMSLYEKALRIRQDILNEKLEAIEKRLSCLEEKRIHNDS